MTASTPNASETTIGAGESATSVNAIQVSIAPMPASTSRPLEIQRLIRSSAAIRWRQNASRRPYSVRGSKEGSRQRDVVIDRRVQLGDRDELVRGVRGVNRAGAEEERLAPLREKRNVRGVRK